MFISYNELIPKKEYPCMMENLEPQRYENQDKIVSFLRSGEVLFAKQGHEKDIFTGERLKEDKVVMNSGEYSWSSVLAYYFDKYNLKLPSAFEKYILSLCS